MSTFGVAVRSTSLTDRIRMGEHSAATGFVFTAAIPSRRARRRDRNRTMYRGRTIFVVIPAYNVADHIAQVVKRIPDFVDRIVVVNDTSTDDTLEVLAGIPGPRRDGHWIPRGARGRRRRRREDGR